MHHYLTAQAKYHEIAKQEMQNALKINHYIWFIFPQIINKHLQSDIAKHYALKDLNELNEYCNNQTLKQNLLELYQIIDENVKDTKQTFNQDDVKFKTHLLDFTKANDKEISNFAKRLLDKFYNIN